MFWTTDQLDLFLGSDFNLSEKSLHSWNSSKSTSSNWDPSEENWIAEKWSFLGHALKRAAVLYAKSVWETIVLSLKFLNKLGEEFFEIQRIILLTHLETILAIVLLRSSPNVLKATLEFLYYRRSCFQESTHTTSEKLEEENPTVGFLVLYSLFQGPGFRIPLAKLSRIPESGFPYIGRFLRILQVFWKQISVPLYQSTLVILWYYRQ